VSDELLVFDPDALHFPCCGKVMEMDLTREAECKIGFHPPCFGVFWVEGGKIRPLTLSEMRQAQIDYPPQDTAAEHAEFCRRVWG
jgi:hypothetical protein